jgi:ribokinase
MVGAVGDDAFGRQLRAGLEGDGIDCRGVRVVEGESTGVALIVVDEAGRNGIVVVPGGNGHLSPADLDRAEPLLAEAEVVVLQLETRLSTVMHAVTLARARGKTVVLNPAPAQPLPRTLVEQIDFLVPNEIEAAMLTGRRVESVADAGAAGEALRAQGARNVLVTLGARGVVAVTAEGAVHHPAPAVKAVDSTAAGDTFIGGLCAGLVEGRPLSEAVRFAQAAAALSVTRFGAQTSIPHRREVTP